MTNRSLITNEVFVPVLSGAQLERPIIFGVVGTSGGPLPAGTFRKTKTNTTLYGALDPAGQNNTIPRILKALSMFGVADVVVHNVLPANLADGWANFADQAEARTRVSPTHLVGDDQDWTVTGGSLDNTAPTPLAVAKESAAQALSAYSFLNAPRGDPGTSILAWAGMNAGDRVAGCAANAEIVPTFRPSAATWTMGPAPFFAAAMAAAPFYHHPEYLELRGISDLEVGAGIRFAPKDISAGSEELKFGNVLPMIGHRGSYHIWGRSFMQAAASIDVRKYVEIRQISDHFENVIELQYLINITAQSRAEMHRLICGGIDMEINRIAKLQGILGGSCEVDEEITNNQVGYIVNLIFEHPVDTVKVTKVIQIG